MKKNDGCEYCAKNCKDKSNNAYGYCQNFIKSSKINSSYKENDIPPELNEMFGGIFK